MLALLLTTAAAWWMAAVAWLVQSVNYPWFARVGADAWVEHHRHHSHAITPVVVPGMATELVGAALVAARPPDGTSPALAIASLVLALLAVGLTAAVAAPAHGRLSAAFDPAVARRLLTANLVRAMLWTAHGAVCLVLLAQAAG